MSNIVTWLQGKKTYVTAIVTFCVAGAAALGYTVPPYVYAILGAFGITFLRTGMTNAANDAAAKS
jgi:hypothetical protein